MLNEIYDMLKEGISSTKAKYVDTGKMSEDVFNMLLAGDPSRKKKYVEWMAKQYVTDPSRPQHIIDTVGLFNHALMRGKLERKDIFQYKTVEELESVLSELELEKLSKAQQKKEIKKDVDIVLDTDELMIVVPKTWEASCLYGKHTKWCTAGHIKSYWNNYYDQGSQLYYIIDKINNKKYAIEVSPSGKKTAFDEMDHTIDFGALEKKLGLR